MEGASNFDSLTIIPSFASTPHPRLPDLSSPIILDEYSDPAGRSFVKFKDYVVPSRQDSKPVTFDRSPFQHHYPDNYFEPYLYIINLPGKEGIFHHFESVLTSHANPYDKQLTCIRLSPDFNVDYLDKRLFIKIVSPDEVFEYKKLQPD